MNLIHVKLTYYLNVIFIYPKLTKNITKERFISIKLYLNCDTDNKEWRSPLKR